MSKNSYSDDINNSKLMISGLKSNSEKVSKRGLDTAFISEYETIYAEAQTLDNEQESLKAKLKEKTEKLEKKMSELKKKHSESEKIVKLDMPQSSWKEFGIQDKK
jgi:hypothetical protein